MVGEPPRGSDQAMTNRTQGSRMGRIERTERGPASSRHSPHWAVRRGSPPAGEAPGPPVGDDESLSETPASRLARAGAGALRPAVLSDREPGEGRRAR